MLRRPPPMCNGERQRLFRERNPGYYGRLHAKARAATRAAAAAGLEAARAAALAPARAEPLLLPAPVELPVLPGLNTIPATPAATPEHAPLPLPRRRAS